MGLGTFIHFNSAKYECEWRNKSEAELQAESIKLQQKVLAARASIVATAGTALATANVGVLAFVPMSIRRADYNHQKEEIIAALLAEHGWQRPELRKRDVALAVGPTTAASCVGMGQIANHAAHHAVSHAAQHAASHTHFMAVNALHAASKDMGMHGTITVGEYVTNKATKQAANVGTKLLIKQAC